MKMNECLEAAVNRMIRNTIVDDELRTAYCSYNEDFLIGLGRGVRAFMVSSGLPEEEAARGMVLYHDRMREKLTISTHRSGV